MNKPQNLYGIAFEQNVEKAIHQSTKVFLDIVIDTVYFAFTIALSLIGKTENCY